MVCCCFFIFSRDIILRLRECADVLNEASPVRYLEEDFSTQPIDPWEYDQAVWNIIEKHFEARNLVCQQIDSYNEFVEFNIKKIIESSEPIILKRENRYGLSGRGDAVSRRHG